MAISENLLRQVETYQPYDMGNFMNSNLCANIFNTKFTNFNRLPNNLGNAVTVEKPIRSVSSVGLIPVNQPIVQRLATIVVDQAANVDYAFTDTQSVFNLAKDLDPSSMVADSNFKSSYLNSASASAALTLSSTIEKSVLLNANSSMPVYNFDPTTGGSTPTGAFHQDSGPFRFFGNGETPLNSQQQLASMLAQYRTFGAPDDELIVVLPLGTIPPIIATMLQQFVTSRNEELAGNWHLGSFGGADFYQSNLLPTQYAGTVGENQLEMTVVSRTIVNGVITSITFSGAPTSDANAVKYGDMFQSIDANGPKFYTFRGNHISPLPIQGRVTADAASDGAGEVTVSFYPGYVVGQTNTDSIGISEDIVAGQKFKFTKSHVCGFVGTKRAAFFSMPPLNPKLSGAHSKVYTEPDSGLSIRDYFGSIPREPISFMTKDAVWYGSFVPEYFKRILVPLNAGI